MSAKVQNAKQTVTATPKRETANPAKRTAQSADVAAVQRAMADPSMAGPADLLAVQRMIGNRAATRLIQTKLTVGPAGDQYEQEADQMARQVMTMPAPAATNSQPAVQRAAEDEEELQMKPLAASITPLVQRQEDEDELQMKPLQRQEDEDELQMKPLQRQEDEDELQMKPQVQRASSGAGFEVSGDFEQQLASSRGGGSPLPASVRHFMEPRFGADFSSVRIHTGGEAAQLNRSVSAQAFTHGSDIYLGEGKDDLGSPAGHALLAHELTHTIQQGAVARQPLVDPLQRSVELLMRTPDIQRLTEEEWLQVEAAGLKRTAHSDERAIQRDIWASSIINTYRYGTPYSDPDHPNTTVYYSSVKKLMLAVSNDDNSLITAYRCRKPANKWVPK